MSRLKLGQIAPGIAAKAARSAASVNSRLELLAKLEALPPSAVDQDLVRRFLTVQALACWEEDEKGVSPLSPKTLQKYLSRSISGGYWGVQARARRLVVTQSSAHTSTNPNHLIGDAESENHVDATLMITTRYLDLLERIERLRLTSEEIDTALKAHFRLFQKGKPFLKVIK